MCVCVCVCDCECVCVEKGGGMTSPSQTNWHVLQTINTTDLINMLSLPDSRTLVVGWALTFKQQVTDFVYVQTTPSFYFPEENLR